jgi:predicted Zn-dependent protease
MENLQKDITSHPDNTPLRVQSGKAYLRQGKPEEAIEAFRVVRKLTSDPGFLATCGKALIAYEQAVQDRKAIILGAAPPAAASGQ